MGQKVNPHGLRVGVIKEMCIRDRWYYFSSNGEPKVGPKISDASTSNLVRINNITYLFNEKGNPVYGLRRLEVGTCLLYTSGGMLDAGAAMP